MRFTKLALLLAALILAGCAGQPSAPPPPMLVQPRSVGPARGIDLPSDTSDVVGELRASRLDFVARYYRDPTSRWPSLSPTEAQRLAALGVKIVTVWEWHSSTPSYFTYASGYNDAVSAARQAKTIGQPPGSAIYFAVDFNAREFALYQVDQYFRGINAGMAAAGGGRPEYRIGVYGSGSVCTAMRGAGLAQYTWLSGSTAWDGTAGYDGWNIRQAAAGGRFPELSFDHDANEARNDYGGFQLAGYGGPTGALVTAVAAVPFAAATAVNNAITASSPVPPPAPAVPRAVAAAAPPPSLAPPAPRAVAAAVPPPSLAPPAPAPPPRAVAAPAPAPPARAQVAAVTPAAPRQTAAEAEVAAAVAAEPPVAAERAHAVSRPSEPARTSEEPVRERSAPSKRSRSTVALNARAAAAPVHHAGGAEAREPERKISASLHPPEHNAHAQAKKTATAHAAEHSASRTVEQQHRPGKPHHASDS